MLIFNFTTRATLAALAAAFAVAAPAASADPGQQGMAVVRDPQTGQLRAPTGAELRAMLEANRNARQAQPQAAPAQAPTRRPDGVRAATLGERGMVYSVVRRGPDGSLKRQCIEGEAAAVHAAHHAPQHDTARQTKEHHHE